MKNFIISIKISLFNFTLVFINKIIAICNDNYKYAFILPFILKTFNPENNANTPDPFLNYAFSMLILSTIVLGCFINIIGYIISIYLISKYDIESKYPK